MNKSTKKVLTAIAATVFTSTAFAANWVEVTPTYEVDTESILRAGNLTSFWARYEDKERGAGSNYVFFDIKCAIREIRARSVIAYSLPKGKGEILSSSNKETSFTPIAPGSHGISLYTFVCTSRR